MCLAIPGKVLTIEGDDPITRIAQVQFGGITKRVSLACVPDVAVDQYVLVHAGLAISVIDNAEAQRVFEYLERIDELTELSGETS
ncbi:MAG: HypC/HybG/HupF family hydrogenase formation chaperone [Planctomycetes bacterium]|nr:HypC/HybG/HupF family hydrogenase formation chaperone [Planctomycetota bacterium]